MKKMEIKKTRPNFIISVLKDENHVVLVSSISNFFINKMSLANKWMRKKIPSFCNLALTCGVKTRYCPFCKGEWAWFNPNWTDVRHVSHGQGGG